MIKIYNIGGSLVQQFVGEIEIYNIFGYFNNAEYINYDDTYISLTRLNYPNSTVEIFQNFRAPGQLGAGFIDGYVTQITGTSIYENIIYDNDCLSRGRAINNFNERSDLCTFTLPSVYVSGATKIITGTTSASTGVYIVDTLSTITFTAIYSSNTEFFTANTNNNVKFELFKRITPTNILIGSANDPYSISPIINTPIFGSNRIYDTGYFSSLNFETLFSGYSGFNFTYDLSNLEGEFVIKDLYKWINCTYFSKLIGLEYYENFVGGSYPYYLYNPDRDYYFVYLKKAEKPSIYSNITLSDSVPFSVFSIKPNCDGQTNFPIGNTGYGVGTNGILVAVNGIVLSTEEYVYSSNTLIITGGTILMEDVITVAYSNYSNAPTIQNESYTITSIPNTTYPSIGQKVIFNTNTNKYEYWLNYEVLNQPIFTVNGQVLSNQIDYYVSSSNRRRIILEITLNVNDIITVFYNSIMRDGSNITNKNFELQWTIPNAPSNNLGYFFVEITNYGDNYFNSPIFTGYTFYVTNQNIYTTNIYFSGGSYGDKFIAKVTNFKNYYTVLGELIQSFEVSEIIPLTITTNALNNY